MSTATTVATPRRQELCIIAYFKTWEILSGNLRPNFDDLYKEIISDLRQQQDQKSLLEEIGSRPFYRRSS